MRRPTKEQIDRLVETQVVVISDLMCALGVDVFAVGLVVLANHRDGAGIFCQATHRTDNASAAYVAKHLQDTTRAMAAEITATRSPITNPREAGKA